MSTLTPGPSAPRAILAAWRLVWKPDDQYEKAVLNAWRIAHGKEPIR